jgi:hypothetical protein
VNSVSGAAFGVVVAAVVLVAAVAGSVLAAAVDTAGDASAVAVLKVGVATGCCGCCGRAILCKHTHRVACR